MGLSYFAHPLITRNMATKHSAEAHNQDIPDGSGKRFGIVVSEWNNQITESLLDGCLATLEANGVSAEDIIVEHVPGSFELPLGARILASGNKLDGIVCLGCVIKGETKHDEYISNAVANGIMQLGLMSSLPVIFGVLTPNNMEQALPRASEYASTDSTSISLMCCRNQSWHW